MKRTPLERRTPLRPKRWGIRPRRPRRLDKPQSDPARLAWVRLQVCDVWRKPMLGMVGAEVHADTGAIVPPWGCQGRTEACHEGRTGKGMGTKCPDAETMPMCTSHHRQWTDHTGIFKGWTKQQRREWADERIAEATARYLSHGARRP